MTIENSIKILMEDVFKWIENFKDDNTHLIINFPSMFIHKTKGLLKNTENTTYSQLNFLKGRNLNFDFNGTVLKEVKFCADYGGRYNINRLNTLLEIERDLYYKNHKNGEKTEILSKNSLDINGKLLDLQTINNFKF